MKFSGSLSRYILPDITEDIFWRGVAYAGEGRVKDFREESKKVSARIAGTHLYEVEFRQGPKYIKGYCTCPYALNEDYCKHVAALAVYWDMQKSIELPSRKEVGDACMEIDYGFGSKLDAMYRDPLHADLKLLAEATDYGSWVRPHARISLASPIKEIAQPVSLGEVRKGLEKIAKLEQRAQYDPYFCAGEVSALLCLAYDAIIKRYEGISKEEYLAIAQECVVFYYNTYLQMIDGSDGVWQIPMARIQLMLGELNNRSVSKDRQAQFRAALNERIKGWGDIFEDLEIQF